MPLVNIGLLQQQEAAASSNAVYPIMPNPNILWTFRDTFERETLNPTNAYNLYDVNAVGSGTVTIVNNRTLRLLTEATIGSEVSVRASGTGFGLGRSGISPNGIEVQMNIAPFSTTDVELFFGIVVLVSAMTGLPTTVRHLGVFVNQSASNNYILSSGNGSAQSTTDSGVALSTTNVTLKIVWDVLGTAIVELLGVDFDSAVQATHTVSDTGMTNELAYQAHMFVNPEGGAVKDIRSNGYIVKYT